MAPAMRVDASSLRKHASRAGVFGANARRHGACRARPIPPDARSAAKARSAGRPIPSKAGRLARHMLVGEAAQLVRERLALVGRKGKRQRQQLVHQHVHERHGAPAVRVTTGIPAEEQVRVDRTLGEAAQYRQRSAQLLTPPSAPSRATPRAACTRTRRSGCSRSPAAAYRNLPGLCGAPPSRTAGRPPRRTAGAASCMALHGYGDAEVHALPRILREPSVRAQCVLSEADAQAASLVERGIEAVGG